MFVCYKTGLSICTHVRYMCMYVHYYNMFVRMYTLRPHMYVCIYVCIMYVLCMYVRTYVCTYMYSYILIHFYTHHSVRDSAVVSILVQFSSQVVCGYAHSLALTDTGELFSWGSNSYGQLGTGSKVNSVSPTRVVEDIGRFVEIAACHYSHVSAGVLQNSVIHMWGQCRGQSILSPMETNFDNLDDVFACFASPATMWRPLVIGV